MKRKIPARLIAQRKALGLNLSELAELPSIEQSKQAISHYELGNRKPAQSYIDAMNKIANDCAMLQSFIKYDINSINDNKVSPFDLVPLPYFSDFNDYIDCRGGRFDGDLTCWRVWQAALSHLVVSNKLLHIDDSADIPMCFTSTRLWFFTATI